MFTSQKQYVRLCAANFQFEKTCNAVLASIGEMKPRFMFLTALPSSAIPPKNERKCVIHSFVRISPMRLISAYQYVLESTNRNVLYMYVSSIWYAILIRCKTEINIKLQYIRDFYFTVFHVCFSLSISLSSYHIYIQINELTIKRSHVNGMPVLRSSGFSFSLFMTFHAIFIFHLACALISIDVCLNCTFDAYRCAHTNTRGYSLTP